MWRLTSLGIDKFRRVDSLEMGKSSRFAKLVRQTRVVARTWQERLTLSPDGLRLTDGTVRTLDRTNPVYPYTNNSYKIGHQ